MFNDVLLESIIVSQQQQKYVERTLNSILRIDQFRVTLYLCFKTNLREKPFICISYHYYHIISLSYHILIIISYPYYHIISLLSYHYYHIISLLSYHIIIIISYHYHIIPDPYPHRYHYHFYS